MSETSPDNPNRFPSLRGLEAVTLVSLVLNAITVVVLIVARVARHPHFGGFRCHEGQEGFHHGPEAMAFGPHPGFGPGPGNFGGPRWGGAGPGQFGEERGAMGGPVDPAQFTDRILDHLSRRFALTDAQKTQLRPILEQQAQAFVKDREAQRQAHQQAFEAVRAKIRAVLTPDQQKQFDQEKAEHEHGPEQH